MTHSMNIYNTIYKNYTQKLDKPLTIIRGSRGAQKGGSGGGLCWPLFWPQKTQKNENNEWEFREFEDVRDDLIKTTKVKTFLEIGDAMSSAPNRKKQPHLLKDQL